MMAKRVIVWAAAAMLVAGCFTGGKSSESVDLTLEQTPAPVRAAIVKLAGADRAVEIEREMEDGRAEYEVEYVVDGVKHSAKILADGTVVEQEMELKALPPAVAAAVAAKYPKAKVDEMTLVREKGKVGYEVVVEEGKSKRELTLDEKGKVVKDEKVEKKGGGERKDAKKAKKKKRDEKDKD